MASDLWIFAGLIVLGQFSPGPDFMLLTRTALREGRGAGLRMAAGIACGLMVHAGIAVTGVAVLLLRFPMMRLALQWLAAVYLIGLSVGLLKSAFAANALGSDSAVQSTAAPVRSAWLRGLLCNLLNPKVALFLAAVCAPFLTHHPGVGRAMALWLLVVGLGFFLWSLWVLVLQWGTVRRFNEKAARWIDGFFGVALILLALRLMIPSD